MSVDLLRLYVHLLNINYLIGGETMWCPKMQATVDKSCGSCDLCGAREKMSKKEGVKND